MTSLEGTPSDDLPEVSALGTTDVGVAFVSFSARDPDGRDEAYLAWHGLDHCPEQYRLDGLRHAQRLVSTPACRAVRASSHPRYEAVDHVMTYLFTDHARLPAFGGLGAALGRGGRMPLRLPSVELGVFDAEGRVAAPSAKAGADVLPWRPALGAYLLVEEGDADPPRDLADVAGVAGLWWFAGARAPGPFDADHRGIRLSYCFLDDDPVLVGSRLVPFLERRWQATGATPLLAAPFHTVVPFEWGRHLP